MVYRSRWSFTIIPEMGIASDIIYIVIAALCGGLIALYFRQPLLLGYIGAGIIVGPYTGGVTVHDLDVVERLAEIGIGLLLFTLGLELSFQRLRDVFFVALAGTVIQLALCTGAGYLLALGIGLEWREALWFGALISVSSTVVVLKTLGGAGAVHSLSGRVMVGMLVMQDLAIVPMILILPQITQPVLQLDQVADGIMKSLLFLGAMYLFGLKLFPRLFLFIARLRSRELFFLCTLAIALGIGYLTFLLGLSFPFGAFVAGMALSDTDFRHQALSDVTSLRDLFGLLFFVSVGMLLNPWFLFQEWRIVLAVLLVVLFVKIFVVAVVVRSFGYCGEIPLLAGLCLSQIGEFSFAVASVGLNKGHISEPTYSLFIAATVLSMASTPVLYCLGRKVLDMGPKFFYARYKAIPSAETGRIPGHVVITGGGVIGEHIANVLSTYSIPFVIIEIDHFRVSELQKRSYPVVFGDARYRMVLKAAGIQDARLLIIAAPGSSSLSAIIREVQQLRPTLPVVARVEGSADLAAAVELGIREVVQPKLEASLELIRQSLLVLGINRPKITDLLDTLRARHYNPGSESGGVYTPTAELENVE